VAFLKVCQEFKRNSDFHHWELWERYSCSYCIFFFVFNKDSYHPPCGRWHVAEPR